MQRSILLIAAIVLLFSCTNNNEAPTVQNREDLASEAEQGLTPDKLSFFGFLMDRDDSFSTTNFTLAEQGTLEPLPATPMDVNRFNQYRNLLIYNKDSTRAIDLFSYNYVIINKDSATYAEAGEPDTEVALVDLATKQRRRLLFVGPSFNIADARWLDSNSIQLSGGEVVAEGQIKPTMWKVNIKRNKIDTYVNNDTVNVNISDFFNNRYRTYRFE